MIFLNDNFDHLMSQDADSGFDSLESMHTSFMRNVVAGRLDVAELGVGIFIVMLCISMNCSGDKLEKC